MAKTYPYKLKNLTMKELSLLPECKVSYKCLFQRIKSGTWNIDEAVTTKTKKGGRSIAEKRKVQKGTQSIIIPEKSKKTTKEIERIKKIMAVPVNPRKDRYYSYKTPVDKIKRKREK